MLTASPSPSSITNSLYIQGWQHLDAILLASLVTEIPVLLVGLHGTAKTYLVEQLAKRLGLNFRHYNASLLNYDDLVGIPIPDPNNDKLRFITTPSAIWDAEFVFFDEISRCRPDLQNKLFPIIHERRVLGVDINTLRFRWSAMNPPAPDLPDLATNPLEIYLGSESLDPALIDRFGFIIPVPNWHNLTRSERQQLIRADVGKESVDSMDIVALMNQCCDILPAIEEQFSVFVADYIITLFDLLERAKLPQSPRRARMLLKLIMSIHASRVLIEGEDILLEDSAEQAILYCIPQNASTVPPSTATLVAIHKQAWQITNMLDDEQWRQILEETDPLKRILIADQLEMPDADMSMLITQALASDLSEIRKISISVSIYLRFRARRQLAPSAWEPLIGLAGRVLFPRVASGRYAPSSAEMALWKELHEWVITQRSTSHRKAILLTNFVLGCFPDVLNFGDWNVLVTQFSSDLEFFGVTEELL